MRHKRYTFRAIIVALSLLLISPISSSFAETQQIAKPSGKKLKLKVAIGRFTNETNYGKSLLRDNELDPLGKQAADILTAYLTKSESFLIFERPDLNKIMKEQKHTGGSNIIGVDTLIVGSVIEFGRSTDGKRGIFNKKKVQKAHAKVAIRLVDVRTGLVFHSATGSGEATTATSTVLGVGSTAKYDASLNDKAISIAIEDLIEELVTQLSGRTWKTDILKVAGTTAYISGGKRQGLKIGDTLIVMKQGEVITSNQSGFDITLPAEKIGELKVVSLFGDNETTEGAVTKIISGTLTEGRPEGLFVTIEK
ncbi:CsgG/HfaB family protein [Paremcibacter congregatus]|uniref:Curli production assembly protein CsgG n=1 Tax=Paremcibacter congregatus TaxID=2043170 RepID=A0A2G4YLV6_9PROT|nr:CsgG/HfaB family protein [Paremcibacter congregatus]PHZ83304.1 curli production assembly protein CsgG [Paremcibacter congregatus]QDE28222.1 curli production assembly protein CsgG [Paremcibacter congregatus]